MEKTILITGANGRIGTALIQEILQRTSYRIIEAVASEAKYKDLLERLNCSDVMRIQYIQRESLFKSDLNDVYAVVHLAFARRNRRAEEIAGSIDYSMKLFQKAVSARVQRIINISTQGIYGETPDIRVEAAEAAPLTAYTMAKYATEKFFDFCFDGTEIEHTNLRLDLIVQSQNLVPALCRQAKQGLISLKGGEQRFSFLDVKDAALGILAMIDSPCGWEKIYNVGWNKRRYKLTEIAELVADAAQMHGYSRPEILLEKQDIALWSGMNSERFSSHTGWKPKIDMQQMILKIFEEV